MTPDDDAIEAIRARWIGPTGLTDSQLASRAEDDVRKVLAALDARTAEAQRERERAEAAEAKHEKLLGWSMAQEALLRSRLHGARDTARREAIEEACTALDRWQADYACGRDSRSASAVLRALLTREAPSTDEGTAGG